MKKAAKVPNGSWDVEAYKRRLRLLREVISGENQTDFAERLGMDFKRWNNYERGYPVPREVAFILFDAFHKDYGISIDWIWWGQEGNLRADFKAKIKAAQDLEREEEQLRRAQEKVKEQEKAFAAKRKKVIHPALSRG